MAYGEDIFEEMDPFEELGVTIGDSKEEIKKKYRLLIKQYHRDNNPDTNTMDRIQNINQAYEDIMKNYDTYQKYATKKRTKKEEHKHSDHNTSSKGFHRTNNRESKNTSTNQERVEPFECTIFFDGTYVISKRNGYSGLQHKDGRIILDFIYTSIDIIDHSYIIANQTERDSRYRVLNTDIIVMDYHLKKRLHKTYYDNVNGISNYKDFIAIQDFDTNRVKLYDTSLDLIAEYDETTYWNLDSIMLHNKKAYFIPLKPKYVLDNNSYYSLRSTSNYDLVDDNGTLFRDDELKVRNCDSVYKKIKEDLMKQKLYYMHELYIDQSTFGYVKKWNYQ